MCSGKSMTPRSPAWSRRWRIHRRRTRPISRSPIIGTLLECGTVGRYTRRCPMTVREQTGAVPAPLDQYTCRFDHLFRTHLQRQRFREYLAGLLLPRDRNKTLTALAGAEPIVQAQTGPVQRLQWFLSESRWDAEAVTAQRIALLQADPATRAHAEGALVIDETGDRKDGTKTAPVGYQYLGSIGKVAHGIVAVTSRWADAQLSSPLHGRPDTPAARLAGGTRDAAFRTKPQLALEVVRAAQVAG